MKETTGDSRGEGKEGNGRILTLPSLSWALYDLANTVFSMNIVSFFFSLWVVNIMGGSDSQYGYTAALSYAIIFFLSPFLGALTDQSPRRMPFLVVSTLVCVSFTFVLGTGGVGMSLAFFVVANIAYQSGLQFYDALLPEVSTEGNRGRVGGLGIGLGYLGSFIGLFTARWLLTGVDELGTVAEQSERFALVFKVTAILFLAFALPCFFFVRERVRARRFTAQAVPAAVRQVAQTFRGIRRFPGLGRFLIGRVFYTDAVNTVIAFMGIYVTNEVGFSTEESILIMLVATAFAVPGGMIWGVVADRIGPKRTLDLVLYLWMVVFVWATVVGYFKLGQLAFWPVAVLAGLGLGGTWAADRPLMLRLTPPARIGEFYGLYNMVGRFSAVTGPFTWAFVAERISVGGVSFGLGLGRPAAVGALALEIVIAWWILRRVSDAPRTWGAEEPSPVTPGRSVTPAPSEPGT
jgi:MFS transporter, UMF1 family